MAESPALKPVYLLTGSDRPKIETALARLRRHFEPEAIELVSAQERSGAEAAALCNAGSLFGDARLVLVEGVDGRRNNEGRLANGWKAADVKAIEEYLASPAPGTVLALVAEELKKDAPLTKACAKAGDVLAFEVAKRKVDAWVAERFKQAGVRAEPDAVAALVQLVGEDFHQLANEIDKLALWAGDEPIGEHEVEQLVAAVAETPTFALTDAWAQRDAGRTLDASETIFEREGRPRRDTAPRLAGALGEPPRVHAPLPAARRRGRPATRRRVDPEAASVLRREGVRPGRATSPRTSCARPSSGSPASTTRSRAAASWRPTSSSSEP